MNDEQIKQRIQYLVEHGGVYDDPIRLLNRQVRILKILVVAALALNALDLTLL